MNPPDQDAAPPVRPGLRTQGLKFLATGVLNTGVGYALYYIGLWLGLEPRIALAVATAIGAVFNYFSTGQLVFRYRKLDRMPCFVGAYVIIYVFNAGALTGLIALGVDAALAQLFLLPVFALISFLVFRRFVFFERGLT